MKMCNYFIINYMKSKLSFLCLLLIYMNEILFFIYTSNEKYKLFLYINCCIYTFIKMMIILFCVGSFLNNVFLKKHYKYK